MYNAFLKILKDKIMKIALLNKKGGVGKTPFAFSIAKDFGYFLQSNDNSCIEQIYPDKAKILDKVKDLDDCVYDFGGFSASGVLDIIKNCDVIIIPCLPTYNSFIRTVETINEIISINPNIILLATNYKDDREEEFLENELDKRYKDIPTFYLLSYIMKALYRKGATRAFLTNIEDF